MINNISLLNIWWEGSESFGIELLATQVCIVEDIDGDVYESSKSLLGVGYYKGEWSLDFLWMTIV